MELNCQFLARPIFHCDNTVLLAIQFLLNAGAKSPGHLDIPNNLRRRCSDYLLAQVSEAWRFFIGCWDVVMDLFICWHTKQKFEE